jgi:NAD(P)-dependent dehydrogenase (short-subunit alcohol dehydrogenase family)
MAGCSKIAVGARSPLVSLGNDIKAAARDAGHPEPTVLAVSLDISSEDSVKAAAAMIGQAFGQELDVLIAHAGHSSDWAPVTETNTTEWRKTIDVNVNGLYLSSHYFLPLLLKSNLKLLIAVSSIGAVNITPGASSYQVSKLAVSRFVEFVDQEYHTQGLIALSVHPGGVKTDLGATMPEEYLIYLCDEPELPADHMVWLAAKRREWLAGRFVLANWDVDELEAKSDEIVEKNLLKFALRLE